MGFLAAMIGLLIFVPARLSLEPITIVLLLDFAKLFFDYGHRGAT